MHILHFISDFTDTTGALVPMVRRMLTATSRVTECHLLTCVPLSADYVKVMEAECHIHVHFLHFGKGVNPLSHLSARLAISRILKTVQPDVVHVHGSWDWHTAAVERAARSRRIVTIVSPHRGLSQELLNIDFWNHKLPRLLAYQVWMIRNCSAVVALNEKEAEGIRALNLKRRIEVLPPSADGIDGEEQLCKALLAAYSKSVDTAYAVNLTENERRLVQVAVAAAVVAPEEQPTERPSTESLDSVSYRRVFFYAHDEDVMQLFSDGCRKLGIPLPPIPDVAEIPRYHDRKAKSRGALKDCNVSVKGLRLPEGRIREREAVTMICKAWAVSVPRLTLRHYAELYDMFRHSDFDEDMVQTELKRLRLRRFTKRLQRILARMYGIKSGYDIF